MKNLIHNARLVSVMAALAVASLLPPAIHGAEIREFLLGNTSRALSEAPVELQVVFRAMRFNEVSEQWNVDVLVTNTGTQTFSGIVVLTLDSFTGTSGPLRPDGLSAGMPYFQVGFPAAYDDGLFGPRAVTPRRTISLGFLDGQGPPRLTTKIFAQPAGQSYALALTRSLDGLGQPLPGVRVTETTTNGSRTLFTDSEYGVVTLGRGPGEHVWRFDFPGHLPVWRSAVVPVGNVRLIPNPRLAARSTNVTTLAPGIDLVWQDGQTNIQLTVPATAFSESADAFLTPLDGQTLPALLPPGWSPLRAFWLELEREPAQPIRPASPGGAHRHQSTRAPDTLGY